MAEFDLCGEPWQHQLAALEKGRRQDGFALFFEPGCGKSFSAILLARRQMWDARRHLRTLIVAPPVVLKNWKNEWLMHSKLTEDQIAVLTGNSTQREAILAADPVIAITNYESLLMPRVFAEIKRWAPKILIADESHRIRNFAAKRTKRMIELATIADFRYILTGTPVLNSPMDLFPQFLVCDRGETFGKNFFKFRKTFFYDRNANMPKFKYFPDWHIQPGALDKISKALVNRSMHVKKSDCLDLPPLLKKVITFELTSKQRKAYDDLSLDLISYLNDKACVARIALTKSLRLMQLVTGHLPLEGIGENENEIHVFDENPRKDALRELLTDITPAGKVVVWAVFKQNYADIRDVCEGLGLKFVELHGEVSTAEKHKAVDAFDTDPTIKVLIGHPGSGGIGVNLVKANAMVFYSRNWNLEFDIQAEARNYRGGSHIHTSITRYDLVAENSIDETVLTRLENKQDIGDDVVKDLKQELIRHGQIAHRNGRNAQSVVRFGNGLCGSEAPGIGDSRVGGSEAPRDIAGT